MPSPEFTSPAARRLRLYVRDGCHLCAEALEAIESLRPRVAEFELELVDIEQDEQLHAAYLERIPVAELDGRELFALIPDIGVLEEALAPTGTFRR